MDKKKSPKLFKIEIVEELVLGIRIFISSIEAGILPSAQSPCHKKMKELRQKGNKVIKSMKVKRVKV